MNKRTYDKPTTWVSGMETHAMLAESNFNVDTSGDAVQPDDGGYAKGAQWSTSQSVWDDGE